MINQQIALEREMSLRGIVRYNKTQEDAVAQGRGSETSYSQRIIPEYVTTLADAIEASKQKNKRGVAAKYLALLRDIDSNEAAFITLRRIFDSLIQGGTVNNLAIHIGQRVEDQIRFTKFEQEHAGYYDSLIQSFKASGTSNYRHMHRVLLAKANEKKVEWVAWTPEEKLQVGVKLVELCILSTGLIEKVVHFVSPCKSEVRVVATPDTLKWIEEHKAHAEVLNPETMPCLIPPCDWVDLDDGGYFTPEIRQRVNFIKTKSKAHRLAIKGADYSIPMRSVNKLQQTAWRVNTRVHDVIKEVWRLNLRIGMPASEPIEIPPSPVDRELRKENMDDNQLVQFMRWKRNASKAYTSERERFSKCLQLSRVLQMAEKFRAFEEFYYVYTCDFRGRIYCASPGLSPQGADFSKGLLEFANGVPLGAAGVYWLCVHGANVYGYDKASYDQRVEWVSNHEAAILEAASDPLGSAGRAFWSDADKPWQFLAFCFEYADYKKQGESYESHLAVALDGSCNGLQNFSAMLRDNVGAQATNLCASDKPEDIYQRVADVCKIKLTNIMLNGSKVEGMTEEEADAHHAKAVLAAQWLEFDVTRKCAKRPVMTLPYGSTRQSCREYIEEYIIDNIDRSPWEGRDIFTASLFLSGVMWDSIGDVVVAAREAMSWLQTVSRSASKENIPLEWTTPTGFKVYQGTMKSSGHRVKTQLCGSCRLMVSKPTNDIDGRKQSLGIAPNFVHSMDASHLIKTVDISEDIVDWAMIHDSYGTHAAKTDELHRCIRRAFIQMYTEHNVLQEFRSGVVQAVQDRYNEACCTGEMKAINRLEKLQIDNVPAMGAFDINEVQNSLYFFG